MKLASWLFIVLAAVAVATFLAVFHDTPEGE